MLRRQAEFALAEALADTPVVLIHGPRQSGKSTMAQTPGLFEGRYVTLDDPDAFALANSDPAAFLSAYPPPVVIDEVQRAPGLFLAIKLHVDKNRRPGMFLLTGSANVLNLPKMADSLAGRMEIIELLPFTQGELEGKTDGLLSWMFSEDPVRSASGESIDALVERIVRGGFPEPALRASAARRSAWFTSYVKTLLERDVRDIAQIEALTQMPRLLRLLAARAGSVTNMSTLASDSGIPYTSLRRYVALLESVFLLQPVQAWRTDRSSIFAKAPKSYIVDTGLLCHLINSDVADLKRDRERLAPILENFVAMELRKQAANSPQKPWLLHLRTLRQLEVDLIIEAPGGTICAVEVRPTDTVKHEDANGLRYVRDLAPDQFRRGALLYAGSEIKPLDRDIWALPISALWHF